ncbi:MAG: hypothetical protein ACR2NA_11735 [Solirubrobacterales bacterium]
MSEPKKTPTTASEAGVNAGAGGSVDPAAAATRARQAKTTAGSGDAQGAPTGAGEHVNQGATGNLGPAHEHDPFVDNAALYVGGAFAAGLALAIALRWLRG